MGNLTSETPSHLPAIAGGTPIRSAERRLVFGCPSIGDAEISEVVACLKSGWIGQGQRVERFESEFARYKGAEHAIAVTSGTAAIQLSLFGLGIRPGDEVIVPSMTFTPSLNALLHAGATPVVVDCVSSTFNIDPEAIERRVTDRTRAILAVHIGGRPCDMNPILEIARRRKLRVIEDCAHAIEGSYHGKSTGLLGDVGCFSFYATKNLTTADGGMVITKDKRLHRRMKLVSCQGMSATAWQRFQRKADTYRAIAIGFRCNMNDFTASLGLAQLARLTTRWQRREQVWQTYAKSLQDLPLRLPPPPEPGTRHAYHLYSPLLEEELADRRGAIIDAMWQENIGMGVHYIPVHRHPYFRRRLRLRVSDFPNADAVGTRTISLPFSPELTDEDIADVCAALRRVVNYQFTAPSRTI
jgi:dTDP-4-amino-4,6-dideoxygalactose transaminase